jgi:hypothetical protein
VVLAKQARGERERTRGEAYALAQRCSNRLASHTAGKLHIAEDVRLPMDAVVRLLWKVRGIALAQWKAARAAETAPEPAMVPAAVQAAAAEFDAALEAFVRK